MKRTNAGQFCEPLRCKSLKWERDYGRVIEREQRKQEHRKLVVKDIRRGNMPDFLDTKSGRRLAYHKLEGRGPGVVFLGGFKSDMEGTKAIHLEAWAKTQGRAFLRFDYSGHGQSSEEFTEGAIGGLGARRSRSH
ncbi:Mycophenolic acid acyl-glucuronide esterase, mitochondrial [Nymphon striatum]|nr:Mycophenolic acid acyl-glucuronide esterase, mitochondrial [Nymphon striatum]